MNIWTRIVWSDPTGNTGKGQWLGDMVLAKMVAQCYRGEVRGRKVFLETAEGERIEV